MPRFHLTDPARLHDSDDDADLDNPDDLDDADDLVDPDDLDDADDAREAAYRDRSARRRSPKAPGNRRVEAPWQVAEGRSGRTVFDPDLGGAESGPVAAAPGTPDAAAPLSSYDVATHGPGPAPAWLVTALSARDTRLGTIKSGKEADVTLLERAIPGGASCLLAVKTYRSREHRAFHRDAGYLEGRRVRRTRESRAMAARTAFGRNLLASQWAVAEFGALCGLWSSGARVPYPVQLLGTELMMQLITAADGSAAPRLVAYDGTPGEFTDLWHDLVASLEVLAADGMTHGDLSAYNVLVDEDGCVLIDLPQVVDLIGNPQGMGYLERDCRTITGFFASRGVRTADSDALADHLRRIALPAP